MEYEGPVTAGFFGVLGRACDEARRRDCDVL